MAPTKAKKQQKKGVDFKKIKRKLGRKLPPPKNATNTEVKFKAIILPQQSVASEKIGLAVNKKGLTLKELLQQTSHHNAKVRKDALIGIRDLLVKHPAELTLHKYAVIEKLRERIGDEDKMVRETLFQLFKAVIFPGCKEDSQGILISLLTAYIFNAMTHLAIEIRLMAFKFFDLVVQHYPNSFFQYADKILQSYEDILQKNKLYLQEKGKLKSALSGLVRCLSLLPCDQREVDSHEKKDAQQRVLYAFDPDLPTKCDGHSSLIPKVKNLVPVLVNCFEEFVPAIQGGSSLDGQTFDCILCILQSIDILIRFFLYNDVGDDTISKVLFKKLIVVFPLDPAPQISGKSDERYFTLNTAMTEIYLHLNEWKSGPDVSLEIFLIFIERTLLGENHVGSSGKAVKEKHLLSLLPFIPKLVTLEGKWNFRLLQAFTRAFLDCSPESSLKIACLSTVEQILINREGVLYMDPRYPDSMENQIAWIRELPMLLIQLGDKHHPCSQAVLRLQLKLGKCALLNPSLALEYDNMQHSLQQFFSTRLDDGNICYGPFMRLPGESQELSLCCLYYYSSLESSLLKSISRCCLSPDLEPLMLYRIIEILDSAYKAGRVQIADCISFFITLVSSFKIHPDNIFPVTKNDSDISNRATFKAVTSIICSCVKQIGDPNLVFRIIENVILDQMTTKPPLDNVCAMLRLLASLDTKPSEGNCASLANLLVPYLLQITQQIPEHKDENYSRTLQYYTVPCFMLFDKSHELLNLFLQSLGSLVNGNQQDQCAKDRSNSTTIFAIVSVLHLMHNNVKARRIVSAHKEDVHSISRNILRLQSSDEIRFTLEEKHNLRRAVQQLEAAMC